MRNTLLALFLSAQLWMPMAASAAEMSRSPLAYTVREYGMVLFMTLLGGFVGWYSKVRKGEIQHSSLFALIGEMATSSLAGLGSFLICDYMNVPIGVTGAVAGLCGYMGGRAIEWAERKLQSKADRVLGDAP